MRYLLLLLALPASADIHKCVDPNGAVSYQGIPCPADKRSADIDSGYVNDLPVAPPPEEREAMARIREARKARQRQHIRRRDQAIREYTRRYEQRKAQCMQLKQDYRAWVITRRRDGRPGDNNGSELIREMRNACSGWSGS